MNIKILDSWLREYLKTDAKPKQLAEALSLTSVSIERIEDHGSDKLYDIEVTTNRPDIMSVVGLAREAAAVLPHFGYKTTFLPPKLAHSSSSETEGRVEKPTQESSRQARTIKIINDPKLVNRILAVVMEVEVGDSPKEIKDRLETSDIRSLNNVIDVTNYVMRTIGHPAHVFDFDRLNTKTLTIRESKKGETIKTLDKKEHTLLGGDIVAVDDKGRIVDLLGIMGLENSVVTENTKQVLYFIDNNDPLRMRKTSMGLAIRTDAAQINEKDIDPELSMDALLFGIELFKKIAKGKVISPLYDIYPNKPKPKEITVSEEKINRIIGVAVPLQKSMKILTDLGFTVSGDEKNLTVSVPTHRIRDISLEEDVIEEVARVYGYYNLPSVLPEMTSPKPYPIDEFYWENRTKDAMKYWGYTEVYTYSMVSSTQFEGPLEEAVKIRNPLTEDHVYMRKTLVPSLLEVIHGNKTYQEIKIFEIANTYHKEGSKLPKETRVLAGVLSKPHASFFEVKGIVEQIAMDLGITKLRFKPISSGGLGADVYIDKTYIGEIEILDENLVNFELNFETLLTFATLHKTYTPISKYPPVIEDLALIVRENVSTGEIIDSIQKVSPHIREVSLLDKYHDSRTFHIIYQDKTKNMTTTEVAEIRSQIVGMLQKTYNATIK